MTKSLSGFLLVGMCAMSCFAVIEPATLEIGWGEADITPPTTKRIPLCGQYYQRLADTNNPFHSRLKFVALALKQGNEHVLMGSIDNVTVWQPFVAGDRARTDLHGMHPHAQRAGHTSRRYAARRRDGAQAA